MAFGVAAGVLVVGHVLVGTLGVVAAARWLDVIFVGALATGLYVLHVLAARRLIRRRRRDRQVQGHAARPLRRST